MEGRMGAAMVGMGHCRRISGVGGRVVMWWSDGYLARHYFRVVIRLRWLHGVDKTKTRLLHPSQRRSCEGLALSASDDLLPIHLRRYAM